LNALKRNPTAAASLAVLMVMGLRPACSADDAAASGDAGAGGGDSSAGGDSNSGGGDSNGNGGASNGGGGNPSNGTGPGFVYADVVEGCVKLVACGSPDASQPNPLRVGVPGLGNSLDICVTSVLDLLSDDGVGNDGTRAYMKVIDCARDHPDCAGFLDCLVYPYTDQACEDQGPRCDGDTLVACLQVSGAKAMVTDCAVLGMTCVEGAGGRRGGRAATPRGATAGWLAAARERVTGGSGGKGRMGVRTVSRSRGDAHSAVSPRP